MKLPHDPAAPDYYGGRFVATAYRTTRALLLSRHLLPLGRSLQEAMEGGTLQRRVPIDPTSPLRDVAAMANDLPTLPDASLSPEESVRLATVHGFTALKLGIDPEDPCLHWFGPELFGDFFPSEEQLLEFEAALMRYVGKSLVAGGRFRAAERMERVFGPISIFEKKDWAVLPMNHVRDFASVSTDDDRTLMVARLEGLAEKARAALDLRLETSIQRIIATLQGLNFQDADKQQRELYMLLGQQPERSHDLARLPVPES